MIGRGSLGGGAAAAELTLFHAGGSRGDFMGSSNIYHWCTCRGG